MEVKFLFDISIFYFLKKQKPNKKLFRLIDVRNKEGGEKFVEQLLKKAQRGDGKALEKLFLMQEASLYRIAFLYVRNEEDALDVMQEVAYRTFKNIKSLKNVEYFKTWITKITINCAIDHIRQNGKLCSLESEFIENMEQVSETQEKEILLKVTIEDLMNVLEPEEKSVILLKYYQEYSFREISELLRLPLGTVKTILYRALKKLKEKAKEID